jgi:Spy/CpxP family protein refolding chaperone
MVHRVSTIVLLGVLGLSSVALAAPSASPAAGDASSYGAYAGRRGRGSFGFIQTLQTRVGLTPEQGDAVRGLLADQRQQMNAIREKTDTKIRALLTSQQQPKFDQFISELKNRRTRPS